MEKVLLFLVAAALMASSAGAQPKISSSHKVAAPESRGMTAPKLETAQMRAPGTPAVKAPKKAEIHKVYYNRPAGMYPGSVVIAPDGSFDGLFYAPYFAAKPFAPYTFKAIYDGGTQFEWDVPHMNDSSEIVWETGYGKYFTCKFGYGIYPFPVLWVKDGDNMYDYQIHGVAHGNEYPAYIMSAPNAAAVFSDIDEGGAILVSSKTLTWEDVDENVAVPFSYYGGMDPYGNNPSGYWFGKNGGTVTNAQTGVVSSLCIDGIAQAFEKPSHPYLLKRVVLNAANLAVLGPVDMTCKIYKIADGIPPYEDEIVAILPEEPGELIAYGRATVTPETEELIVFTLYCVEDGLEIEYTPTIDSDILVAIDGYNDPGMENLKNFTAMIFANIHKDEGFGELAYLKHGLYNYDGTFSGDYEWVGLNNFFASGEMKTGLSIFLDIENPFLSFYYKQEDGEYTFPPEGGVMGKVFQDDCVEPFIYSGIEFYSWVESADDGWTMTCDGGDVPDWLSIELTDGKEEGEFDYHVNAAVVAKPLPQGVHYREAVVRFGFPGAYLDYKFMQGEHEFVFRYDMNGDGEVNIADIDDLIDYIIRGQANIGHLNALIDYILSH
ncbi:MAG: hypothetical protein IJG42_12035 [Muribaculaceae bacterium]|nr:hypothetical protein [Muribaculaceae bacterium]